MLQKIGDTIRDAGGSRNSDKLYLGRTKRLGKKAGAAAIQQAQVQMGVGSGNGDLPRFFRRKDKCLPGFAGENGVLMLQRQIGIVQIHKQVAGKLLKGKLHRRGQGGVAVGIGKDQILRSVFWHGKITQEMLMEQTAEASGLRKLYFAFKKFLKFHGKSPFVNHENKLT